MRVLSTLMMTIGLCASGATLAAGSQSSSSAVVEKTVTAQSPTGESMEITQVLKPNADGTFTVMALEPADKVEAFYDRACKEELGEKARYTGPGTETRLSKGAISAYSCEISGSR